MYRGRPPPRAFQPEPVKWHPRKRFICPYNDTVYTDTDLQSRPRYVPQPRGILFTSAVRAPFPLSPPHPFFPKSRRGYTRYSHLGAPASSSLVICVATMADRRPGNYSVCMRACVSLSLSLSLSLALPHPFLVSLSAAASRASFLSAVRVILRFETSCPIPRLRPPTRVSRQFFPASAARIIR